MSFLVYTSRDGVYPGEVYIQKHSLPHIDKHLAYQAPWLLSARLLIQRYGWTLLMLRTD
jgi:hypothetical protein